MEETQPTYHDEMSLRDLFIKTQFFIRLILRNWFIPAIFILLCVAYQGYTYLTYVPVYPATITFSVDEDEGGGSSGLTSILGQFGLGSYRPSRYNLDKILALSKSRRVIENTLFTRATIDGNGDFLANHLIREYELNLSKSSDSPINGFYFTHDSLSAFTRVENEMLLMLYSFVIGPPDNPKLALITNEYDDDSNIIGLGVATTNETLSLTLAHQAFESLSDYYINKAVEKQLKTYHVMSAKRDSVLMVLKSTEFQLANFRDSHRNLVMRTDQLADLRLQREIAALSAMYVEVLKNTEVASFSLKNKMPFIQVIDEPLSPIHPTQISLVRKLLIGILVGGFLGSLFVVGRHVYHDLRSESIPNA